MSRHAAFFVEINVHKIQQAVKWSVYVLLLINFAFYIVEDWNRAVHTLHAGSTPLDWTSEFATSIDESAWFILLFMFELETYILEDETSGGRVSHVLHGVRLLCYAMLAHTIYAFLVVILNLQPTIPVENVSGLCDLTNRNVSFVYNLEYTEVNEDNCHTLSDSSQIYWLDEGLIVSDMEGLNLERDLALADLVEAVVWLVILFAIEVVVRLQGHGVTGGALISTLNMIKRLLYLTLIALGIYWAWLSHWLYLWDELLWIGGFAAIEMNVSQWRDELLEKQENK